MGPMLPPNEVFKSSPVIS